MLKRILDMFYITLDRDAESEIIQNVSRGVSFRGFNLWVLVFAIFVASLGLNTNSTAVIIGAMLISPLMGPIIGMGVSMGINDIDLLKRSVRNYLVATVVSVLTATVYFYLSPLQEAHSELFARTSPSIYDVLIAFFGGAAGIVAIFARERGNVVPGVAIATALMPPLCTAGFGIATGQWEFFFGAFYLFFINTVFISFATFIGVRGFRFTKSNFDDTQRGKRIRMTMIAVAVLTVVPSVYLTVGMVRESMYTSAANEFIKKEFDMEKTKIVGQTVDFGNRKIDVVLVGQELSNEAVDNIKTRMSTNSQLQGTQLFVRQSAHLNEIEQYVSQTLKGEKDKEAQLKLEYISQISKLQDELAIYQRQDSLSASISQEVTMLFPSIRSFSIAKGIRHHAADSIAQDTVCFAIYNYTKTLSADEALKLTEWLKLRVDENVEVIGYASK